MAQVVVIGGRLDKEAQVTVGAAAVDFLRTAPMRARRVRALHPEAGLSTDDLEEAHEAGDGGGVGRRGGAGDRGTSCAPPRAYLVAPVAELTHLVSVADAPDELLDPYRALGGHR